MERLVDTLNTMDRLDAAAPDFVYKRNYDPLIAKTVGEVRPRLRPKLLPLRLTSWTTARAVRAFPSGTGRSRSVPRRARAQPLRALSAPEPTPAADLLTRTLRPVFLLGNSETFSLNSIFLCRGSVRFSLLKHGT